MQSDFIQFINLTFKVADQILLNHANCTIKKAEFVAIIGANGVGKTSLLKLLAGLLQPSLGRLQIRAPYTVGYAPDVPPLYPHDTVHTYIQFIGGLKQVNNQAIAECLHALDLESVLHKKIITLSKGTQQRVNIAQAVINKPSLVLLDEPTNGLDEQHCQRFCDYLKVLQSQGSTIIIASHQYSDFVQNCDYMLKMYNKNLIKILSPIANNSAEVPHDQHHHTT